MTLLNLTVMSYIEGILPSWQDTLDIWHNNKHGGKGPFGRIPSICKCFMAISGPGSALTLTLNIENYDYTSDPSEGSGVTVNDKAFHSLLPHGGAMEEGNCSYLLPRPSAAGSNCTNKGQTRKVTMNEITCDFWCIERCNQNSVECKYRDPNVPASGARAV